MGEEGFRKAPVGAGPYKFVSLNPGVELVVEAFEGYWRKAPSIKRIVFRSLPDETTRAAALKSGEVDLAMLRDRPDSPGHPPHAGAAAGGAAARHLLARLPRSVGSQIAVGRQARAPGREPGARSPGAQRGRDAGPVAPHRQHRAARLRVRAAVRSAPHDPARAKKLLAEAGYPNGFDAGELTPFPPYNAMGETIQGWLSAVGIRTRMRAMERGTFMTAWREKKLHGVVLTISGVSGNAATRLESFVTKNGAFAYGALPEVDDLFRRQARELDHKKREALLHQIQKHPARAGGPGAHLSPGLSHRRRAAGGRHHGHRHPRLLHVAVRGPEAPPAVMPY